MLLSRKCGVGNLSRYAGSRPAVVRFQARQKMFQPCHVLEHSLENRPPPMAGRCGDTRAHRENRKRKRGAIPSPGSTERHLASPWSCTLAAPASRRGMASSHCLGGTACQYRCSAWGSGCYPYLSGHRLRWRCAPGKAWSSSLSGCRVPRPGHHPRGAWS